eukprot:15454859-Alexandrium_andersonii.AAC.1
MPPSPHALVPQAIKINLKGKDLAKDKSTVTSRMFATARGEDSAKIALAFHGNLEKFRVGPGGQGQVPRHRVLCPVGRLVLANGVEFSLYLYPGKDMGCFGSQTTVPAWSVRVLWPAEGAERKAGKKNKKKEWGPDWGVMELQICVSASARFGPPRTPNAFCAWASALAEGLAFGAEALEQNPPLSY